MKLLSFAEAIKKTKTEIDEMMIPIRVKQAKLKGETELAKIEEKLLNLEVTLHTLCADPDINYTKIREGMDEAALLERQQKQLKQIMTDLFGEAE